MNQEIGKSPGERVLTAITVLIALMAGAVSLCIATAVAWQHAASPATRALLAAVNMFAVVAAHLLPAISRRMTLSQKALTCALWLVCLLYTLQGQAGFKLASEREAGVARAASVLMKVDSAEAPHRERAAILSDKAALTEQLSHLLPQQCSELCRVRIRAKRSGIEARIQALDAEAEASGDQRQRQLHAELQAQQAQGDPFASQLSDTLGLRDDATMGATAVMFALILEGVGALCWTVVFRIERSSAAIKNVQETTVAEADDGGGSLQSTTRVDRGVTAAGSSLELDELVTEDAGGSGGSALPDTRAEGEDLTREVLPRDPAQSARLDADYERVLSAVHNGNIRPVVKEVRGYLRCRQGHAHAVTKLVKLGKRQVEGRTILP